MNIFKLQDVPVDADSMKGILELVILTGFVCQPDRARVSGEEGGPVEDLPP